MDAIESVLDQSYANMEIIVVNDGSTDGSQAIIDYYNDKIKSITVSNGGANKARNIGLKASTGRYIMFLDADDFLESPIIEKMVKELERIGSNMVFGPWIKTYEGKRKSSVVLPPSRSAHEWIYAWLCGEYVPSCAVMWRRTELFQIGGWDELLRKNQDGDLVLRGLMNGSTPCIITEGCGIYRQHNSPHRVSGASIEVNHESNSKVYHKLFKWITENPEPRLQKAIGLFAYGFAAFMYERNENKFGDIWLERAISMGVKNASNSFIPYLIGALFGLRKKRQLKRKINAIRDYMKFV